MPSKLLDMIADHLREAGWQEKAPGQWLDPSQNRRRRDLTTYDVLAAAQVQITHEFYETQRAERERLA